MQFMNIELGFLKLTMENGEKVIINKSQITSIEDRYNFVRINMSDGNAYDTTQSFHSISKYLYIEND